MSNAYSYTTVQKFGVSRTLKKYMTVKRFVQKYLFQINYVILND